MGDVTTQTTGAYSISEYKERVPGTPELDVVHRTIRLRALMPKTHTTLVLETTDGAFYAEIVVNDLALAIISASCGLPCAPKAPQLCSFVKGARVSDEMAVFARHLAYFFEMSKSTPDVAQGAVGVVEGQEDGQEEGQDDGREG